MLLLASPLTAHLDVCQRLSQMFVVDKTVLREVLSDFKDVPGLRQEFVD